MKIFIYLIYFILGIILFLLWNSKENFSIGIPIWAINWHRGMDHIEEYTLVVDPGSVGDNLNKIVINEDGQDLFYTGLDPDRDNPGWDQNIPEIIENIRIAEAELFPQSGAEEVPLLPQAENSAEVETIPLPPQQLDPVAACSAGIQAVNEPAWSDGIYTIYILNDDVDKLSDSMLGYLPLEVATIEKSKDSGKFGLDIRDSDVTVVSGRSSNVVPPGSKIVKVNNTPVASIDDFNEVVAGIKIGTSVAFTYRPARDEEKGIDEADKNMVYSSILLERPNDYKFMYDKKKAIMAVQYANFRGAFSGVYDPDVPLLWVGGVHAVAREDETATAPLLREGEHDAEGLIRHWLLNRAREPPNFCTAGSPFDVAEYLIFDVICKPITSCLSSICNLCSSPPSTERWTRVLEDVDSETLFTFLEIRRCLRIDLKKMMIFDSNVSGVQESDINERFTKIIFPEDLSHTDLDIRRRYQILNTCLCRGDIWSPRTERWRRVLEDVDSEFAWHHEIERARKYALQLIDLEDKNLDVDDYRSSVMAIHAEYIGTSPSTIQLKRNRLLREARDAGHLIEITPEDLKRPFIQGLLEVHTDPAIDITEPHMEIIQEIFTYRQALSDGVRCDPEVDIKIRQCIEGSNCYIDQTRYDHMDNDRCINPDNPEDNPEDDPKPEENRTICYKNENIDDCTSNRRSKEAQLIIVTFTEVENLGITLTFNKQMGKDELSAITPPTQESHPQLKVGMILQSIADTSVSGMSHDDVIRMIRMIRGGGRPLQMSFYAKEDVCVWTPRVQFTCESDIPYNTEGPLPIGRFCTPYNDRCNGNCDEDSYTCR